MPVTDVRVALRVASSDHLRPRAMQGSGVAIEATILDQDGEPVVGAVADLSWISPDGIEIPLSGVVADAKGKATALAVIAGAGVHTARCVVTEPQPEVAEAPFEMVAGAVQLVPVSPVLIIGPGDDLEIVVDGDLTFVSV